MANETATASGGAILQRPIDPARDHIRWGQAPDRVSIVLYGDYLCPYCRRLRAILGRLHQALGDRLAYIFRHFPNERAHPGSEFFARAAEAAGRQGRYWDMHDQIYGHEPPLNEEDVRGFARDLGLDMQRFERDLQDNEIK